MVVGGGVGFFVTLVLFLEEGIHKQRSILLRAWCGVGLGTEGKCSVAHMGSQGSKLNLTALKANAHQLLQLLQFLAILRPLLASRFGGRVLRYICNVCLDRERCGLVNLSLASLGYLKACFFFPDKT